MLYSCENVYLCELDLFCSKFKNTMPSDLNQLLNILCEIVFGRNYLILTYSYETILLLKDLFNYYEMNAFFF